MCQGTTSLQARLNASVIKRGGGARREVLSASGVGSDEMRGRSMTYIESREGKNGKAATMEKNENLPKLNQSQGCTRR
jgi:hypothetical protein